MKTVPKVEMALTGIAVGGFLLATASLYVIPQYTYVISFGVLIAIGAVEWVAKNYEITKKCAK